MDTRLQGGYSEYALSSTLVLGSDTCPLTCANVNGRTRGVPRKEISRGSLLVNIDAQPDRACRPPRGCPPPCRWSAPRSEAESVTVLRLAAGGWSLRRRFRAPGHGAFTAASVGGGRGRAYRPRRWLDSSTSLCFDCLP